MRDNNAWMPRDWVTVCDVEEQGACWEGIVKWVMRKEIIAGNPSEEKNEWVKLAARLDGDGYGHGHGDVDGYGHGDGDVDGYGDGDVDGDGYGDGDFMEDDEKC